MAPTHKKRLLLLCGTSLLALQLAALPLDPADPGVGVRQAQAQESCFTAGTLILMADGSLQPIEELRSGDLVVGRRGRINRVMACERTSLGPRRVYALNGGRPFVTAEHPFLTAEGWKALDPEATRRENARLRVAPLQLGDRLCRGTLGCEPRAPGAIGAVFVQRTTTLEALSATDGDPDTPVFNLLLDGDHSYVADGWIVHNKEGDGGGPGTGGHAGGTTGAGSAGAGGPAVGGAARADDTASQAGAARRDAPAAASAQARAARPAAVASPPAQGTITGFLKTLGIGRPREAGLQPKGAALTRDQERRLIEDRWRKRD